jgi:ketosteroid isomerase-like protein
MERAAFQAWLDAYVEAWRTYDADKISALFSDDAAYRYAPEDEALRGRAAIVASWLDNRDEPGTYGARYEPLAIDGDVHVAHGRTDYFDASGKLRDQYWNVYVCRFNAAGECTDFTEYWIQGRQFRSRAAAG